MFDIVYNATVRSSYAEMWSKNGEYDANISMYITITKWTVSTLMMQWYAYVWRTLKPKIYL